MFAIVEALGRQYRVSPGDLIQVDHVSDEGAELGAKLELTKVLAVGMDSGSLKVGSPFLNGAKVQAEIVEHGRDAKIYPFKMKRRKGFRKKKGFRRSFSVLKINEIIAA